jgi:iron-sulfur cluster assembly accessory protein
MITLTKAAVSQLQDMLDQKELADHGLRIFVQGGGCAGLQYGMLYEDKAQEGDTVLDIEGVRLFIDSLSATYLEGACIDYQETMLGTGFRVDNPNAVASCACGSSFRTESGEPVEKTCN